MTKADNWLTTRCNEPYSIDNAHQGLCTFALGLWALADATESKGTEAAGKYSKCELLALLLALTGSTIYKGTKALRSHTQCVCSNMICGLGKASYYVSFTNKFLYIIVYELALYV